MISLIADSSLSVKGGGTLTFFGNVLPTSADTSPSAVVANFAFSWSSHCTNCPMNAILGWTIIRFFWTLSKFSYNLYLGPSQPSFHRRYAIHKEALRERPATQWSNVLPLRFSLASISSQIDWNLEMQMLLSIWKALRKLEEKLYKELGF